jgi:glycosyltransferase involved in cell wall biosynthesis
VVSERPLRPLFIAKSYPPVVGGMERFSYDLAEALREKGDTQLIANPRGSLAVPVFAPVAAAAAAWRARRRRIDLVHLGDALLAPFGRAVRRLGDVPVTVTVHGLDVTRETPPGYQTVVANSITHLDHVVAVSSATRDFCLGRWPQLAGRISVIPNGVEVPESDATPAAALPPELEMKLAGRRVLLTVGRLIRRKGAAWFVSNVLPSLPVDVIYVIAGEGPDRGRVEEAIGHAGQGARVILLGRLDRAVLMALYERADVFVMPNIVVPNDVEGFGLVALEATVRRTPVVAADLQGIPEAIHDGSNGWLVPPEDAAAYIAKLEQLLRLTTSERRSLGERFRRYTIDNLSWRRAARAYWQCFQETVARRRADVSASNV